MQKKVSFMILSNTGSPVKQVTTSKTTIRLFFTLFLSCALFLGFVVYDYVNLKRTAMRLQTREDKLSDQMTIIQDQRRQIQDFADEISALKGKLVELGDFQKQIRIIANLEPKTDDPDNIFGVGGSMPDDIDAKIPLTEEHNSLMREMHEQINILQEASNFQQEGLQSLLEGLQDQQNVLASTPAIRPTNGWTTSTFGYRISPFTGRREFHQGLDIANREGATVLATADGVVTFVGTKGLLGKTVVIDHGHGFVTRYGHCKEFLKKRGDKVKRWEPIAKIGNTGRSTGPHVHYQVFFNGVPVNPQKYVLN
jgi:murein DD-endopeptidase MepM/ murein hydrolase activator NlpD